MRAALEAQIVDVARYPDGAAYELRQVLARHHAVEPACVTVGNGSNDVLDMIARAFLWAGRESLFSQYAFAVYPISSAAVGATPRIAPALDYGHDLAAMRGMINADTGVVWIANPKAGRGEALDLAGRLLARTAEAGWSGEVQSTTGPGHARRLAYEACVHGVHAIGAVGGDGTLFDVVNGMQQDSAVRPNQILALSLPFPLLDSESAESMVKLVGDRLLVPMGLRTLEPGHVDYQGEYDGSRADRARARHQGSAWTWLLGSYVTALVKAQGVEARVEAGRLLQAAEKHLSQDGLGQISEISWGDAPHWPRGAPAHATGVAELLRAYYEDILGQNPALRADDVWRRRR